MNWAREVANLRQLVMAEIDRRINGIFGWTSIATSSSMGDKDAVKTDDASQVQRPLQRLEPWGFRSLPPAGIRWLWLRLGTSNVLGVNSLPSKGYGPITMVQGESAIYCQVAGTVVKLDKDGNITITPGAGKTVNIAEGTKGVARLDDTITISLSDLQNSLDFRYALLPGAPVPLSIPVSGTISSASSKVKAG